MAVWWTILIGGVAALVSLAALLVVLQDSLMAVWCVVEYSDWWRSSVGFVSCIADGSSVGFASCFAGGAGMNSELEAPNLLPPRPDDPTDSGQRRPADVFIQPWTHGTPAALDLAIVSPQRQDVLQQASRSKGYAATRYEQRKRDYQQTADQCECGACLGNPLQ